MNICWLLYWLVWQRILGLPVSLRPSGGDKDCYSPFTEEETGIYLKNIRNLFSLKPYLDRPAILAPRGKRTVKLSAISFCKCSTCLRGNRMEGLPSDLWLALGDPGLTTMSPDAYLDTFFHIPFVYYLSPGPKTPACSQIPVGCTSISILSVPTSTFVHSNLCVAALLPTSPSQLPSSDFTKRM